MKNFCVEDLYLHHELQSLAGRACCDSALFVTRKPDRASDTYQSRLWTLQVGEDAPRALSAPQFSATSPLLGPDGAQAAFVSARNDSTERAYLIALDGGEATALHSTEGALSTLMQWTGTEILALETVDWAEDGSDPDFEGDTPPLVANFLPWKLDGSGPVVGRRTRVIALPTDGSAPYVLLAGDFEVRFARRSPDGKSLACLRTSGGAQRHCVQLLLGEANGNNLCEIQSPLASITGLAWSPDSSWIACIGSKREGDSLNLLYLLDTRSKQWTCPWPELEIEGSDLVWQADSAKIASIAAHRGLFEVVVADLSTSEYTYLGGELEQAGALCLFGEGLLVATTSATAGSRLKSLSWSGENTRRHGDFNAWVRERRQPCLVKRLFDVPDGKGGTEEVDAWVMHDPEAPRPMPVLMDFHGGPQSVALLELSGHMHWLDLCARGWAIVMPNTVGSGSYGADFARRLRGHWGELDLPQVEAIIDRLQSEGFTDERIACTGKSYGGYLAAWAIGQTQRFQAAVVSAPVADTGSHAGTSDSGYYVSPYAMDGELPSHRARYEELSPTTHSHAVTTPTLLLQGQLDERCPLGQTEQLFATLIRCTQAPVRMVVYPAASHSLASQGRPSHRLDYFRRLGNWVDQWTQAPQQGSSTTGSGES